LLNLLTPHLTLSYNNAEVFERVRRTGSELKAVVEAAPLGYAYVDADGRVVWATSRARDLWRQFYPAELASESGIPHSVLGWVRQASARLAAAPDVSANECLSAEADGRRLEMRLLPSPLDGFILSIDAVAAPRPRFQPLKVLSGRENEVLRWMLEGKRNAEIATILHLSPRTVEKHVQAILGALHVENRATAIIRAMELAAAN
jgi:DNA-binding CsgD family transcriptional regulator